MDNSICKYFFRVHVKLNDPDSDAHLVFDFQDRDIAAQFAEVSYNACDLHKVWTEIVTNEVTTTDSPLWRSLKDG